MTEPREAQQGPRVRVYVGMSLDGFIAGEDDDLSWLEPPDSQAATESDEGALTYDAFMAEVGVLLMGRRTYDVVRGFDVPWPYEGHPVLVVTTRPLDDEPPAGVRALQGSISEVIARAKDVADGKDVYIDGASLIRQAAAEELIDDLTVTLVPVAIGKGVSLFRGMEEPYRLRIDGEFRYGGMTQLRMSPVR